MNFQLPRDEDGDFDYYGNSSQDESRGSQGMHFNVLFQIQFNYFSVNFLKLRGWGLNS